MELNNMVYYWSHDDANFCPLFIRVKKHGGLGIVTIIMNTTREMIGLARIVNEECFKRVVALKLDHTSGTYAFNGEENSEINTDVRIQVTEQKGTPKDGYDKYTHNLVGGGGSMNIVCTRHKSKFINFKESVLGTTCFNAHIYYSKGDVGHDKPLILELGAGDTFYKLNGKEWVHDPNLKSLQCGSPSCHERINVASSEDSSYNYKNCKHSISGGSSRKISISSFTYKTTPQNGLPSVNEVTELLAFHYPLSVGTTYPLLIHYKVSDINKWYKKTKVDNTWEEVSHSDRPTDYSSEKEKKKIKKLLLDPHSPSVVLNIKNSDKSNKSDRTSGEYSNHDNDGNKIKVDAENFEVDDKERGTEQGATEYKKYKHTVEGKTHFKLSYLKHGGNRLDDIKSEEVLVELATYYWVGDTAFDNPLVVMLKVEKTPKAEYIYYGRSNDPGKTWQKIDRESENQEIGATELKVKLDELKAEYFPPSNIGEIVGGTVAGGIGTGGAGFGGYNAVHSLPVVVKTLPL
ncbi:hypothetical protein BEWA_054740 [Theileria equi strain WA]|uniref:Uncharacterized protein n=1 Tax=Theileria equi strain WA TaxID=1537102 RepID=L1LDA1_THEEQ|nr:hypothetical protein BEWA_054740 [Theileria equi strain WA]EKX73417.1 hypothetical protein BEWA_054740 [Theileria equi strain WA]|eukprot:XP_004832869.1 hypothetical protein BEWA_054740 [Theileria equi strain WA]